MAIIGQSASLLFKIDGDATQLRQELRAVDATFTGLGTKLSSVAGIATVAAAGVAVIASSAVTAGAALYRLTSNAAEYGSAIFDAQQKTGLSAAALSTLKLSADSAGSSLEQVTSGTAKFAKMLGEARDGNEKAQASMKALGVNTYDLDTALSQATATIFKAKDGTDQIVLSQKAFGKAGADLIPVIKQFGGDLEAATKEAERLGLTLTEKDIKASDDFGDALGVLSQQAKAAAVAFTSDLMVALTGFFRTATEWYATNKEQVRSWGTTMSDTISGTVILFKRLDDQAYFTLYGMGINMRRNADETETWASRSMSAIQRVILAWTTLGASEFLRSAAGEGAKARIADSNTSTLLDGGSAMVFAPSVPGVSRGGGGGKSGKSDAEREAERLRREAEQIAARNLAAQTRMADTGLADAWKIFAAQVDRVATRVEEMGEYSLPRVKDALDGFIVELNRDPGNDVLEQADESLELYVADLKKAQKALHDLELQKAKDFTAEEKRELDARQARETKELDEKIAEERRTVAERASKARDEAALTRLNAMIAALERRIQLEKELEELREWLDPKDKGVFGDLKNFGIDPENPDPEKELDALDKLIERYRQLKKEMEGVVGTRNILVGLGNMAIDMFENMANAVGNAVAGWALYGDSIGKALRKALAAELAHIAAVAAVNAIYATALGFLRLAQWDFAGAAAAFKSAALWAAVAGVAAVGAKAVAGNAFKQQANTATGSGGSSGQRSGGGGGAYSSQPDQTITGGINSPGGGSGGGLLGGVITIRDKSGLIGQLFEIDWQNNGRIRQRLQAEFGK